MNSQLQQDWPQLTAAYDIHCDLSAVSTIGGGHINDTYQFIDKNGTDAWILQRINTHVFPTPWKVQTNFDTVSAYLKKTNYPLEILSVKLTSEQQSLCHTKNNYWRVLPKINNAKPQLSVTDSEQAFQAAKAVGYFDQALDNLSPQQIDNVIPGFHDLNLRLEQFKESLLHNHANRKNLISSELNLIEKFKYLAKWLPQMNQEKKLPLRVVHNDTKISNILLCNTTGKARAVIDWDTIMPGYRLYDFGDMVRSFTPSAEEDATNIQQVEVRFEVLQALTEGYLTGCTNALNEFERIHLLTGAKIIIFMVGVRFLTDYLNGDIYFKTQTDNQNLNRCRNQFKLLQQLEKNEKIWQQRLGLAPQSISQVKQG